MSSGAEKHLLCSEEDDGIVTISLNRPQVGNRISNEMALEIGQIVRDAVNARVFVIRGSGPDFCLGRDLPGNIKGGGLSALELRSGDTEPVLAMIKSLQETNAPIICAVSGMANGIGTALAAASDVVLASKSAQFRLPEMAIGIPPCLVMTALIDKVPLATIASMVYSGEAISADTALTAGLVGRVVQADELDVETTRFAEKIRDYSSEAVTGVREFLRVAKGMNSGARASYASNLLANILSSTRP